MMVEHMDWLVRYQGTASGQAVLRRKQCEQLGSNCRENQATGKEGEADHRCHIAALGKEETAVGLNKFVQCWTKYIKKRRDYIKKEQTPESHTVVLILINTLRTISDLPSRIIHDRINVKGQNW
jgi:hypothetical protein